MPVRVQVFSDYTCPYCLIGEAPLGQALQATGAEPVFRACLLRTAGPPPLDPQSDLFAEAFRAGVLPLAERFRVEIRRPSHLPLTRLAHEAAAWARTQGRFADFHRQLFRALYLENQDFSRIDVLRGIAQQLRLDPDALETALTEKRMAEEIDEDLLIAESYGIRSVPSYVIGGHILYGVQEKDRLIAEIRRTGRGEPPPAPEQLPSIPISITRK